MQLVTTDREAPISVTHQHLLTTILTLVADGSVRPRDGRLRLLDIGCGDGHLLAFLHRGLTAALPGVDVELHGFDIGEQGYRDGGQFDTTVRMLSAQAPETPWRDRIRLCAETDPWPYAPGSFDIALSNQVLEHVMDLPAFLAQLKQCLSPMGASVHLFPLSHCIIEAHCQTPFAHWIRDFDRRIAWVTLLSRLGVGAFRRHRSVLGHGNAREHAVETARYIQCWTRYRSFNAIAAQCDAAGLASATGFTRGFFMAKLRSLLKRPPLRRYRRIPVIDWIGFMTGRYLSSSTLVIRPVSYDIGRRIAAEKAAATLRKAA